MKPVSMLSFFLFLALIFLGSANFALFSPHEIHLAQEFRTSILAIDFLMSIFTAIFAFSFPVWGFFCDKAGRGGRKNLLIIGTALWGIASLFIYSASSYSQLFVARLISGIGIAVLLPVSFSIFVDCVSSQRRGKVLAVLPVTLAFGAGAGIVLASAFGETAWRPPFLATGIMGLGILVLSIFFLREPERGASEPELKKPILAGKVYNHRINMQKLIKRLGIKTNRWLVLAEISRAIPVGIYVYKVIPYLEMYGFVAGIKTIVTLFIGSGVVFGYLVGGYMGDWANEKAGDRVLFSVLSLFLGMVFLSIAWSMPRSEALWSLNTILFFLFAFLGTALAYMNVPNVHAILADVNEPETRGMSFSMLSSMSWMTYGIGILIGGIGTRATLASYQGMLFWGTFVWILTVLFWLPIFGTLKKDTGRLRGIMVQRAKEMS
jgi:MFS family permease